MKDKKCPQCNWNFKILYKHDDLSDYVCAECLIEKMTQHYPEIKAK